MRTVTLSIPGRHDNSGATELLDLRDDRAALAQHVTNNGVRNCDPRRGEKEVYTDQMCKYSPS